MSAAAALGSNYRLRLAAVAQELAESKAQVQGSTGAAIEAAIRARVLAQDCLARACSSCDERHRSQYPWVLERAAQIATRGKGAIPIASAAGRTMLADRGKEATLCAEADIKQAGKGQEWHRGAQGQA